MTDIHAERLRQAEITGVPYTPPRGYVPAGTVLTAWQSIPTPVRLAAWIWAISVIVGTIGGALFAVFWFLVIGSALGS